MTADDLPHQVRGSMRLMLGVLRQALEDIFHHACHKYGSHGAEGGAQHGTEHGGGGVVASAEDTKAAVTVTRAKDLCERTGDLCERTGISYRAEAERLWFELLDTLLAWQVSLALHASECV
jgi:hypothetical protein